MLRKEAQMSRHPVVGCFSALHLLLAPALGFAATAPVAATLVESTVHLVAANERGVVLEVRAEVPEGPTHGRTTPLVTGALVGIPPGSTLELTVEEIESVPLARGDEWDGPDPKPPAELVGVGFVRSQRVAGLRFNLECRDPASDDRLFHHRLVVRLGFDVPPGVVSDHAGETVEEPAFESVLRSSLVNYEQARRWRVPVRPRPIDVKPEAAQRQGAYKVLVDREGVHQLTYEALQGSGVTVPSLQDLSLRNQGAEIAILVTGDGDDVLEPGEALVFYATTVASRHTGVNVYRLDWEGGPGLRMQEIDCAPGGAPIPEDFLTTRRLEEDTRYVSNLPSGPDDDRWYWDLLYAHSPGVSDEVNLVTSLAGVSTQPGRQVTVRGLIAGYTADPQHHIQILLNSQLIHDAVFDAGAVHDFAVDVSQAGYLLEGDNSVTVRTIADGGIQFTAVLVNRIEIDWHRSFAAESDRLGFSAGSAGTWRYSISGFTTPAIEVLDTTDPGVPELIVNFDVQPGVDQQTLSFQHTTTVEHSYVAQAVAERLEPVAIIEDAPSDLHSPANGADYIVLTHADFAAAAQPLADHRAAQGLRTVVIDIADVYDEFSHGIISPDAITDFLAYAYLNWQPPAPAFVLLVGDGHYDPKDNLGTGEPVFMPPFLADVDPWMGETAADNRFVTVVGADILPDMHIGRLPARTPAEAGAMVAKIIGYDQVTSTERWTWRSLFVADDADTGGAFPDLSNDLIDQSFPASNEPRRAHLGVTHGDPASARAAILAAIDGGSLLVSYFGHAATTYWAQEHLLDTVAVATLSNADRLPLMVPMTSLEGYFVQPSPSGSDLSALAEVVVRPSDRGAVASWSPSGLGVATGHLELSRAFFEAIFGTGTHRIGPAATQAKIRFFGSGVGHLDLVDTYTLFGDPATVLRINEDLVFACGFESGDLTRWSTY
jgi:hypothetical protein